MERAEQREFELRGMFRAEYTRGERFVLWGYGVDILAAIIGVVTITLVPEKYSPLLSIAVAALVFLGYQLKKQYMVIQSYAESARRITVLVKSLGYKLTEKKFIELAKPFSKKARDQAQQTMEKSKAYFATAEEYGPVKLLEMLQESAFWSHSQMEKAAKYAKGLTAGFLLLLIISLYFIAFIATGLNQSWVSSIIVVFVLCYFTSGVWSQNNTYLEVSAKIKQIDNELETFRETKVKPILLDVFALVNEYDCIMMEAPILPDFVYNKHLDELTALWDKRQQEYLVGGWE